MEKKEKIIGYVVTVWDGKNVALDLYEGNYIIKPDGKKGKAPEEYYEDALEGYKTHKTFLTAFEYNKSHDVSVPFYSAQIDIKNPTAKYEESAPENQHPEASSLNLKPSITAKTLPEANPEYKKSKGFIPVLIAAILITLVGIGGYFGYNYFYPKNQDNTPSTTDESKPIDQKTEFVVIAFVNDVAASTQIKEEDLKGVKVTAAQYEQYNTETYISSSGEVKNVSLILWDNRDTVIGKYAAKPIKKGDLMYDTSITTHHVIADKTFVEAEVAGQMGVYEVSGDVLPGNTNIKIVAVISTEGQEPVQVLLSEMNLQDRSLESIFNSAGQDILQQLSQ